MNASFKSQFSYCPFIWMCCNRSLNDKINHSHERSYRMIYKNKKFTLGELLNRDSSVSINHQNIHRGSHRRCSVRKGVPRNFTKFTGKHLCQSLFYNKVAGRTATLL